MKKFIITNLKECFDLDMSFKDLMLCEQHFLKTIKSKPTSDFVVYKSEIDCIKLNKDYIWFNLKNIVKKSDDYVMYYYEVKFNNNPF